MPSKRLPWTTRQHLIQAWHPANIGAQPGGTVVHSRATHVPFGIQQGTRINNMLWYERRSSGMLAFFAFVAYLALARDLHAHAMAHRSLLRRQHPPCVRTLYTVICPDLTRVSVLSWYVPRTTTSSQSGNVDGGTSMQSAVSTVSITWCVNVVPSSTTSAASPEASTFDSGAAGASATTGFSLLSAMVHEASCWCRRVAQHSALGSLAFFVFWRAVRGIRSPTSVSRCGGFDCRNNEVVNL